ncbi:hypothetical protein T492DRAFT_926732, partial [Pavlovales sp. CCMP2436]
MPRKHITGREHASLGARTWVRHRKRARCPGTGMVATSTSPARRGVALGVAWLFGPIFPANRRYCDSDRPFSSRPACFRTRLLPAAALPRALVWALGRLLPSARRIRYRLPKKALALPALRARAAAGKPVTAAAAAARRTTAAERAAAQHMVEMLGGTHAGFHWHHARRRVSRPYQPRELTSPTGATRCWCARPSKCGAFRSALTSESEGSFKSA